MKQYYIIFKWFQDLSIQIKSNPQLLFTPNYVFIRFNQLLANFIVCCSTPFKTIFLELCLKRVISYFKILFRKFSFIVSFHSIRMIHEMSLVRKANVNNSRLTNQTIFSSVLFHRSLRLFQNFLSYLGCYQRIVISVNMITIHIKFIQIQIT